MHIGQRLFSGMPVNRLAVAAVCLTTLLPTASAWAEPPLLKGPDVSRRPVPGTLRVTSPPNLAGAVYLRWTGTIAAPMAADIERAIEAFKGDRTRFILSLNTGGGSVAEGERVIRLLRALRRTHRLDTLVDRGATCGSMCVPLYLQGERRYAALASTWLFHEVTRGGGRSGQLKRVEGRYASLIERYWIPAGVSRSWINRMLDLADGHDYWQTGAQLVADQTGIITQSLGYRRKRTLEIDETASPAARKGDPPTPPAIERIRPAPSASRVGGRPATNTPAQK